MRVGGSAWEFKIDPKMFRKKIKHDIENIREKRGEKKSINNDKKSSKNAWHRLTRGQGFYAGKEA